MNNWNIRSMTRTDAREMARIEKQIFSRPWREQDFLDSYALSDTIYLVAEDENNVIVGYCGCYQSFEEGNISNVAVSPERRRCHIADSLIECMFGKGKERGISVFTLEVRVSNEPAIQLYKKHGFEVAGVRKRFYAEPVEDAMIMLYHQ